MPAWLAGLDVGDLLIVVTLIGGTWAILQKVTPPARRLLYLADDLLGAPARPGVPPRPGVMERLATLELAQAGVTIQLAAALGQLTQHATTLGELGAELRGASNAHAATTVVHHHHEPTAPAEPAPTERTAYHG